MLTVSKALSSGQPQKYHKLEFTSKSQSYYQQGDVMKGEWQSDFLAEVDAAFHPIKQRIETAQKATPPTPIKQPTVPTKTPTKRKAA